MKEDALNILLVRTDRLGDVVLSLPLAEIIKKHYPKSRVTFLVREYTKALVENNPFIDEIITLPVKNGRIEKRKIIKELRSKKFDWGIVVYPTFDIAWILFRAGIKNRVGTGYRLYSFLFNKKIFEHRKKGDKHELEYNVNLLTKLDIEEEINRENVAFNIQVKAGSGEKVDNFFEDAGLNNGLPTVIIHPGSGGSAVDLPFSHFKSLVDSLAQSLNVNILITGNENEKDLCDKLMNERTINTAGMFELDELIALISRADILAANSTGPIHIAAALGKHIIGFYPKIDECAPRRWGPYTNRGVIFTPEIECDNCTRKQCEELNCMSSIKVDKVVHVIENIVAELSTEKN